MSRRAQLAFVSVLLLLCLSSPPVRASYIRLTSQPVVSADAEGVTIRVTVTNDGDEAAHSLVIEAELDGHTATADAAAALPPGESASASLRLARPTTDGLCIATLRFRYIDAKGYPFSVLRPLPVALSPEADREYPPFDALLSDLELKDTGQLVLDVAADAGVPVVLTARLVLPDELACTPRVHAISLEAGEERSFNFIITDVSALPESQYEVFAVVETSAADLRASLAVPGSVVIAAPWLKTFPFRKAALWVSGLLFFAFAFAQCLPRRPDRTGRHPGAWRRIVFPTLVISAILVFIFCHIPPSLLLKDTLTVGGDTPAHSYLGSHLQNQWFQHGRLVSWANGWWCGFPMFQFYFTLPYALVALVGSVVPFNIAFKLVSVLGIAVLPVSAYASGKLARLPRPAPTVLAIAMLPMLFDPTHTMWGVNLYSTLAGMIANSISFPLMLVFVACSLRDSDDGRFRPATSLLLAAMLASHFFTSVIAALLIAVLPFLKPRAGFRRAAATLAAEGVLGVALMAWWLVPLLAKKAYAVDFGDNWPVTWDNVASIVTWGVPAAIVGAVVGITRRCRYTAVAGAMLLSGTLLFFFGFDFVSAVFVNVRLWPFMVYGALALAAVGAGLLLERTGAYEPAVVALLLLAMAFGAGRSNHVRDWACWNYEGLEAKPRYAVFRDLVLPLKGTPGRLANDLHDENSVLGSSRIFECVPHLTGKPVLEGGIVNSAAGSLFSYYVQSETSENCAGFPPMVKPTTFNFTNATRHLALFNVKHFIARWEGTKEALAASADWKLLGRSGPWELHELLTHRGSYVDIARHQPMAVVTDHWKEMGLEWIYRIEALDLPAVFVPTREAAGSAFDVVMTEDAFREYLAGLASGGKPQVQKRVTAFPDRPVYDEHVSDHGIVFRTRAVGAPHIVKMTYFPNWRSRGGETLYMVSPCFMLLFPQQEKVELYYGYTMSDIVGRAISLAGVCACLLIAGSRLCARARAARQAR